MRYRNTITGQTVTTRRELGAPYVPLPEPFIGGTDQIEVSEPDPVDAPVDETYLVAEDEEEESW